MTELEIKDQLNVINDELKEIANKAEFSDKDASRAAQLKVKKGVLEEELKFADKEIKIEKTMEDNKQEFSLGSLLKEAIESKHQVHFNYSPKGRKSEFAALTRANVGVAVDVKRPVFPNNNEILFDKIGADVMTGIKANQVIPVFGNPTVSFATEGGTLSDGTATGSPITLTPHRIGVQQTISRLAVEDGGIDVYDDLVAKMFENMYEKVDAQIFCDDNATSGSFAGLLYNVSPTRVADYDDIITKIESVKGNKSVVLSSALKVFGLTTPKFIKTVNDGGQTPKDTGVAMTGGAIIDTVPNYNIIGTPVFSSHNVEAKHGIIADWSKLKVAIWDNFYFYAKYDGNTDSYILTLNGYVDAKFATAGDDIAYINIA